MGLPEFGLSIDFVYTTFFLGTLSSTLDPTSNVKDALNCRVLVELSRAPWFLKISHRGDVAFHCRSVDNIIYWRF